MPAYVEFDEIGRKRARWEDIAVAWNPSWSADGWHRSPRSRYTIMRAVLARA
jgi:hypothetical protein